MRLIAALFATLSLTAPAGAFAMQIFACEPEWGALAREVAPGADVFAATTARQDPHHIEPRPSLIAKLRRADLVICSGAELEVGWLPMLLRQAGNDSVMPGKPGYLEAAMVVKRLEIPDPSTHSFADIHLAGNPHVHLDPRRLETIAHELGERLAAIDGGHAADYRAHAADFSQRMEAARVKWEQEALPLKGKRLVVHHKNWAYLFDWLGIEEAGSLEPAPGLPPTPGHLAELKAQLEQKPAAGVIRTAYQEARPSEWLAEQLHIPAVELPFTVGGAPGTDDLFGLMDVTIQRLTGAIK